MFKWLGSLVDSNEKQIKKLQPLVDSINGLEAEYEKLSPEGLQAKTADFKTRVATATAAGQEKLVAVREELQSARKRLADAPDDFARETAETEVKQAQEHVNQEDKELLQAQNEALNEILPEAFAAVREAAKRTIHQRPFDVQLMGGMVLHQGKISEMKTGEGKTLVATLPLYLNSLTGRGCHLVTVNDYLSKRDPNWMGPIYHVLGVSVSSIQGQQTAGAQGGVSFLFDPHYESEDKRWPHMHPITRKEAYQADITYGTNNEFGFDYLRDNMVVDLNQCAQRELNYAIVDEVDNILIDEARTPLIISGPAEEAQQKYQVFARLVPNLKEGEDYEVDIKHQSVSLTDAGMSHMESWLQAQGMLNSPNLYDASNAALSRFLDNALKAQYLYHRDREYTVKDGQVIIVDEFTGRMMHGRRYSEGLHQAIEAKEHVRVKEESRTYATITFQNYFRMYKKLAGMTGTAATEAEEFFKIYKLDVVVVPTNRPMIRKDLGDQIYKNEESKFKAVVKEVDEMHKQGRPVLIGTVSIEKSETLSEMMKRRGIKHEVLNAKQHEKEALIVAQAGEPGAVTVATNMAGRGVDIILGGYPKGYRTFEDLHDYVFEQIQNLLAQTLGIEETKRFLQKHKDITGEIDRRSKELQDQLIQKVGEKQDAERKGPTNKAASDTLNEEIEQIKRRLSANVQEYQNEFRQLLQEVKDRVKDNGFDVHAPQELQEAIDDFIGWFEKHVHVVSLGGLHVIGTERHEARRIDNQLRGRTGRQGDPGSSRFYVSLEDDIMKRFGGDRIKTVMGWVGIGEDIPIENKLVSNSIESAQVRVEGYHFDVRKHLVEYDDVINIQRETIYKDRRKVLTDADLKTNLLSWVAEEIGDIVATHTAPEASEEEKSVMLAELGTIMPLPKELTAQSISEAKPDELKERLVKHAESLYAQLEQTVSADNMRMLERLLTVRVIDGLWVDYLTRMEEFRQGVGLQAFAQRDPLAIYKKEGGELFASLQASIKHDVVHTVFHVNIQAKPPQRQSQPVARNLVTSVPRAPTPMSKVAAASRGDSNVKQAEKVAGKKVGRNDPCPCGSGKKYKHCCGK